MNTNKGKLHFKMLCGDINWQDYGGKFVSKKLNNGDWDYWLVISVDNTEDYGDFKFKYIVSVQAVSPKAAGEAELKRAFESLGLIEEDINQADPLTQVQALAEYGIYANLWTGTGNNIKQLMHEAHREVAGINILFGFYMDRQENALGADGWDFIGGNVYGALNPQEHERTHNPQE